VKTTASIVPDISLMKKMASISGTISSRIMELVDNSIDAKLPNKKLVVDIHISKKGKRQFIEIKDNGFGMDEEKARSFFKLGDSQKQGKGKIGRFGLGAKVAILGLGNSAHIRSTPYNENYGIEIDFDINKFSTWEIEYKLTKEEKSNHGTTIRINDITVRIGDVNRFAERLSEQISKTYKHFILTGEVEICVNNTPVKPHTVELIDDLYQKFDFVVNGKRVYGWAGAMVKAGTNWKFGFDLINHGRIIKSNDFLSRQAHTSLARLVGEVHLDEFDTDIHKTDFIREKDDFQEMQDVLINDVLSELLSKVSKLTNRDVFEKYKQNLTQISRIFNKVINLHDFLSSLNFSDEFYRVNKPVSKEKKAAFAVSDIVYDTETIDKETEEKPKQERKERTPKPRAGFYVDEPVLLSLGDDQEARKWSIIEKEDGMHLNVEINMDHPTYQNEEEIEVYMKHAVVDSIAEFVVKEEKKLNGDIDDEIERLNAVKDLIVRHSVHLG